MSHEAASEGTYTQLVEMSRQACETGHYASAYHLLAAAMHYAADARDETQLAEVEDIAHEEIEWIDTHTPNHRLASASSERRGSHNLWESLASEARTQRRML